MMSIRTVYLRLRANPLLLIVIAYFATLFLNYQYYGVLFQFSLGLWFLAAIPIILVLSRSMHALREMSPFIILLLSYEALQGFAGALNSSGSTVLLVFHFGPFSLVNTVQTTFYSEQVTDVATFLYGLHFPLVITSALVLWHSDKILYRKYTYSMIICSYISLFVYLIIPSAPPWYTGAALNLLQVPGVHSTNTSTNLWTLMVNLGDLFESDKLAAFPSLHAAYASLFAYFIIQARRIYALIAVPVTTGIFFSTLYLGQHFVVDLVAGAGLAVSCALLVSKYSDKHVTLNTSSPFGKFTNTAA